MRDILSSEYMGELRPQIEAGEQAAISARLALESIDRALERSREVRRTAVPQLIAKGVLRPDTPIDIF